METNNAAVTTEERILEHLASLGLESDFVDRRTLNQLAKIEEAVEKETSARRKALAEAKAHRLSVSSISKASGISRATFYNKPVLREYLETLRKSHNIVDEESESERLQNAIAEKDAAVEAMVRRDAELVVLASENRRLRHRVEVLESYASDMPSEIRAELESWKLDPNNM